MLWLALLTGSVLVIHRYLLGYVEPLALLGQAYVFVLVVVLQSANFGVPPEGVALVSSMVAAMVLYKVEKKPDDWRFLRCPLWSKLLLLLGTAVIFVYTNISQNLLPDDDYWIHAPLQGLLAANGLPVLHPFFSEIQMNGHYGRDLLIAALANLGDSECLTAQFYQTTTSQICTYLLLFSLVLQRTRSNLAAHLAVIYVFGGINVGGRGGMLDTFQNNNSLVYLLVVSTSYYALDMLWKPNRWKVLALSFVLGSFGLIYETHFGMVGLLMIGVVLLRRRSDFVLAGILALLLAAVQGGPVTKLIDSKLKSQSYRHFSAGQLNQHQIVKLTFPKEELFQIQLAHGRYQRLSCAYMVLPDLGWLTEVERTTPYRFIFSWDVLKIHWLVTLLAPLSAWFLFRRRNDLGLWFVSFGFVAFTIPGLVHFGPIYEFEYFRWEFAAGFGFSVALGMSVGLFSRRFSRAKRMLFCLSVTALNLVATLGVFMPRLYTLASDGANWSDAFLARSTANWVMGKSNFLGGFGYFDLLAARKLKENAGPNDRVLLNFPHQQSWDIHYESTLVMMSGVRSVGHAFPLPEEPVGTPPFHPNSAVRVFWKSPNLLLANQLQANFILLRPDLERGRDLSRKLDEFGTRIWNDGAYVLYELPDRGGRGILSLSPEESDAPPPEFPVPSNLTPGETIMLEIPEGHKEGTTWAWAFIPADGGLRNLDLNEVVSWRDGPAYLAAPLWSGRFELALFEVEGSELKPVARRHKVEVALPEGP